MHYLQVKKVSFRYRDHYFLQDVDFSLQYGQKVGLVARNGMGKSTFLRLLTGELECSEGEIVWNSACRVVFVSQQSTYPASSKVRDLFINPNGYEDWHYQIRYDTLVRELNLEPLLDSPWGILS